MLSNRDILNSIRQVNGAEYQNIMPVMNDDNCEIAYTIMEDYPSVKNAFINTLTNRIGKEMFFNKVFNNPYKIFHRGLLPYGKSIEQLFVELAEKKGFNEHFTGSETAEGDLIRPLNPQVDVLYIQENIQYKFKTSISDDQLRGAFRVPNGLNELLNNIIESLYSSVNYHEFMDIKKVLNHDGTGLNGNNQDKGLIQNVADKADMVVEVGDDINAIAVAIKTWCNKLQFPSNKYNLAGVSNWTNPEDMVVFVTPELKAQLDVNVLAMAFNLPYAEAVARMIVVDELGQLADGAAVKCIVADKDIIQVYDTVNKTATFENVDQMCINYFAHKHGIIAGCKYANAIVMK